MTAVAILPARGGSRRIPRKNISLFHGRPMISYPIAAAKESGLFREIWVSSEDAEIGALSMSLGAKWYPRPVEYAEDGVGTQEVVTDCLRVLSLDKSWNLPRYSACIYPCTPMMTADDLKFGYGLLTSPPPSLGPKSYTCVEGWYYWGLTSAFIKGIPLEDNCYTQRVMSNRYIDINTPEDFSKAEQMYAALHPEVA